MDSYLHIPSDIFQITTVVLHWTWVLSLLLSFQSYRKAIIFYLIGSLYFGSLSLQLVLSHYSMPQTEKESVKITSVFNRQVEVTIDINTYVNINTTKIIKLFYFYCMLVGNEKPI